MTALPDEGRPAERLRALASSPLICVRYPDGEVEYTSTETPVLGDMVMRGGDKWPVVNVDVDGYGNPVVTLGRLDKDADGDGAAGAGRDDAAAA